MDLEAVNLLRENNQMLKEILGILKRITSKEYIEKEDLKSFAINLLADIIVEYKSDELHKLTKEWHL